MRRYRTDTRAGGRERIARSPKHRPGAIIVLTAALLIVMMALLALSIDTGYMYTMQTELDRSVDAAALAGAASLVEGTGVANDCVVEYLVRNPVGEPQAISDDQLAALAAQFRAEHQDDFEISYGHWNATTGQLEQTSELPSALAVSMRYPNLPLFFGRVLGKDSFAVESSAIAMYQPRDIVLVLDFSGSMNDDSELKSIGSLGFDTIWANLQQIYTELGEPQYGNLEFTPQYITVDKQSDDGTQATVEYRYRSVHVTSTSQLSNIKLKFTDGAIEGLSGSGLEATLAGTGANANKAIAGVWVKTGETEGGQAIGASFDFDPGTITNTIKTALDLDGVDYPYPSGSWSDYVNYAKSNSTNRNAGFEYKFGFANLINYWLERKPSYSQTPDLWQVSAQPVTAVKDAVDVFMDYIQTVDTNDRLGLVVYNAPDGNGLIESHLTTNLPYIAELARERQAGHYHSYTNIGGGMEAARIELEQNGRDGAFKMIVLMTDGRANWYNGGYDTTAAYNHVLNEAYAAANLKFPVVTISLGAGADVNLMNQVAEITESRTFNIPGGQPVSDYRDDLFQVFRDIADNRPLKLVQ